MAGKRFDVLVVGELNVDLILNQLDRFPELGKEIIARKMLLTLGS
ncbi:MAG: carbohydrate kinase family protein, partial [Chitinophagaceae bacterium]|nr:carbohydrate kinase family protein [Chitinophagaceae bacterium]